MLVCISKVKIASGKESSNSRVLYDKNEGPHSTCVVKILLMGDSLTEGMCSHGSHFHPYAIKLSELLHSQFNSTAIQQAALAVHGIPFVLHERGVSGETVPQMIPRLHTILARAKESGHPYDIVCILGGTNDLGNRERTYEDIFVSLHDLYQQVHAHNAAATVLAITIPQSHIREQEYLVRRAQVNRLILQYQHFNTAGKPMVAHLDLEKKIEYYESDGHVNRILWDDGLHFTPRGYDLFGKLVFQVLRPIVPFYVPINASLSKT